MYCGKKNGEKKRKKKKHPTQHTHVNSIDAHLKPMQVADYKQGNVSLRMNWQKEVVAVEEQAKIISAEEEEEVLCSL